MSGSAVSYMSIANGKHWPPDPSAFDYGFPKPDPHAIGDCPTCADLVARRVACRAKSNRSGASDINVLLREHQEETHAGARGWRDGYPAEDAPPEYTIRTDSTATPFHEAFCVTDEETCQWSSGERTWPDDVVALMAKHAAETDHLCFRRTLTDYATASPGDWL